MIARRTWRKSGWKTSADYRVICDCQHHARRANSSWRRALRVATRSAAVLMSVPFALALFDVPIEAMSRNVATLKRTATQQTSSMRTATARTMSVFSRPETREQFISTSAVQHAVSLTDIKEHYFRTQVPYGAIIYREAVKNKIAPELVAAMVHTESDFNAALVSHKSAQGLMQIVPETARILGIANVFDPEQNIAAGTRYYRRLLNRFDDERIALAAYNAGEGNVERFGGIPPFPETQQYVEKVHRRASRYRQRVRNHYLVAQRLAPAH